MRPAPAGLLNIREHSLTFIGAGVALIAGANRQDSAQHTQIRVILS